MLPLLLALSACSPNPAAPAAVDVMAPPSQTLDLSVSAILPGQAAAWTVTGLNPRETVYLLWSTTLMSPGPCPAVAGGLCLDIGAPRVLRQLTANASGTATFTTTVPLGFAAGGVTTFQAVALRGVGAVNSTKSDAVSRTTGTLPADQLQPGDLVITEIMKDPAVVTDALGEWVEVTNLSGVDVDLFGLSLSDDGGERFTVGASRVLPAAGRVVFGANATPAQNGGVPVGVVWTGFTLSNADDEVTLDAGNGVIDRVAYDDGLTFPDPVGATLSLSDDLTDATLNDAGGAWCVGPMGPGDGGSPGAANPVCPAVCGDGAVDPGEACDDGNLLPGDGCDGGCQLEVCGDGVVAAGEACDDGNLVAGDGCDGGCQLEVCGDGVLAAGEACDDGNLVAGDGCDAGCQIEPCGNGTLDPGEACDDGNLAAGDGCDPTCQLEVCPNPVSRGDVLIDGRNSGYGAPTFVQVVRLADGDLIWLGQVTVTGGPLGNRTAGYVVRLDGTTYEPEWARLLSHASSSYQLVGAAPAPGDGVWIVANASYGLRPDDVFFARLDPAGALVSHTRVNAGVYDRDFASHVAPLAGGGFAFGGRWYDSFINQNDVFGSAAAISPAGALLWQKNLDNRVDTTERVTGMLRLRNGGVVVWVTIDQQIRADVTMVEMYDANATRVWAAELSWELPPYAATELWNGDVLLAGTSTARTSGRLLAVNASNGTVRWSRAVTGPSQTFYDPVPSITPTLCDPAPVAGQACAVPDARCANTAARICDCTGGTWVCGTERATIDVAWSVGGPVTGDVWTRHDTAGDLVRAVEVDGLLGNAVGVSWRRADGGYGEVLAGDGSSVGRVTVLDTDHHRDAGCGQVDVTTLSTGNSGYTWTATTLAGPATRFSTSADNGLVVDVLPAPTVSQGCLDEVCP